MEFDSKKMAVFHEEPTGIHMIKWKLQTSETQERNRKMIPNAVSLQLLKSANFFIYRNGYLSLISKFKHSF